ncbi:MAG: hypothetical protein U5O16_42450 [Rhodococcus sp. (in: high G+C Gram-positive bacteria)]|uniref:hypothetical protein n=1 Tax=Rhodococcus sp. TaxID=1831 RepID=UPI002ADBF3AC|nr:hypothetical protein [Rhodococcus sp. (in: high G+C Gram-positive bacteria)]
MYDDDNYEHSDGLGGYRRQRGEYVRPAVEWRLPEGGILHDVAATDTYSQFLVQYSVGDVVDAELVPEPHNVFDDHALCVDICGLKVGYVGRIFAEYWHPFVIAMNRRGYSVVAAAEITEGYCETDRSVDIRFPEWQQWVEIYNESGIDHGFDALWASLSSEIQATLMDGFGESDWATTKVVISRAHLMPVIAWKRENYQFIPWPVKMFIRDKARDRDRPERQARSLATKARTEQRSRERADLARRVADLRSHGTTFVAIATELNITASKASTLFREHNSTSPAADSS